MWLDLNRVQSRGIIVLQQKQRTTEGTQMRFTEYIAYDLAQQHSQYLGGRDGVIPWPCGSLLCFRDKRILILRKQENGTGFRAI